MSEASEALSPDGLKRAAAAEALGRVRSGMKLGLGSGSTVNHFLDLLGERLRAGTLEGVVGVPTSLETAERARSAGIALGTLHALAPLDLTVDGADEVDSRLDLIKGLGAALLREKMVADASERLVIIVDERKRVERLGTRAPLPVEVVTFEWEHQIPYLEALGARPVLRKRPDGEPLVTDNGNHILDCHFPGGIEEPELLDLHLCHRPGVVEHGLFLGLATEVIVAGDRGLQVLARPEEWS